MTDDRLERTPLFLSYKINTYCTGDLGVCVDCGGYDTLLRGGGGGGV